MTARNSEVSLRSEPTVPYLDSGRFEFGGPVGSGGMGTVYRAVQRSVGREVAIKVLAPEQAANQTGMTRFVREANAIARIHHPNIVQVIDFGRDADGRMLLVMELLEGESLRALMRRERFLPVERAVFLAVQCLSALRAAHAAGVIHRDLKPENVFVHSVAGEDHVKVLDFGVAKLTQNDPSGNNTTEGSVVGTLRYMAPEQVAGDPAGPSADLYAVGMVLYELLSGTMPYDVKDRFVLMRQIITEAPKPLLHNAPMAPPELCDIVMRAIAKTPLERHASADELRRCLLPFLDPERQRLLEAAEGTPRPPSVPQLEGTVPSGVVRSARVEPLPVPVPRAPTVPPPTLVGRRLPPPAPVPQDLLALTSPPPPRPAWWTILAAALAVFFVALLGNMAVQRWVLPPSAPPRVLSTVPVVTPVLAPAPATRVVLVTTSPPGASIEDRDGTMLCPTTPCGVPVPVDGLRAVKVSLADATLDVTLDGHGSSASIDLTSIWTPTPPGVNAQTPPQPPPARVTDTARRPPRPPRPPSNNSGDRVPLFLPR
ncbi:MAG: protein kinase [Deltaproteobacteria bacterium]|nr:protein kinase [Deltaproteobacteria bacterium]